MYALTVHVVCSLQKKCFLTHLRSGFSVGESLEGMEVPERPEDEAGGTLYKVLNMGTMRRDVVVRVNDLKKLVQVCCCDPFR